MIRPYGAVCSLQRLTQRHIGSHHNPVLDAENYRNPMSIPPISLQFPGEDVADDPRLDPELFGYSAHCSASAAQPVERLLRGEGVSHRTPVR